MADECTDVSTDEELSLFCRWIENGERTEHFIDLLPMKRTDAERIYSALVECLKSRTFSLGMLLAWDSTVQLLSLERSQASKQG